MKKSILLISIMFFLSSGIFAQAAGKFILLEEFSTAPCGFCPDGDVIAEQLILDHPNVIWVTHHAGFGTDSMTVPESVTIANAFTTFAPGSAIDRGDYQIPVYTMPNYIAVSRQKWDSVCVAHLSDPAKAYVGITNNYNNTTRALNSTVDITFSAMPAAGDMRINLYLVEDSVVGLGNGFDQKNYMNGQAGHPCYQKGDPIIGYVHHHVIRKVMSGAWGSTGIIPSAPVPGTKYSKSYTTTLPTRWDPKKMDVVAFVSYYNSSAAQRPVINSNHKSLLDASASGIPAAATGGNLEVYPNPASQKVFITGDLLDNEARTVEIMNTSGQTLALYDAKDHKAGFDISELSNGIYMVRIIGTGSVLAATKLVVLR